MKFYKIKHPIGGAKRGPKDANIQYFNGDYEEKIDILVRETIQNPLDHPLNEGPVRIVFKQRYVKTDQIPFREDLLSTLRSLKDQITEYKQSEEGIAAEFEKFYIKAVKSLENVKIGVLQISDYNTTGLTGSRSDLKSDIGRFLGGVGWWDDSSSGGGSGGLGKFAPFRFSGVNFCLYSSFNIEQEYVYYGWGTNFYHKYDGKEYTGETIWGEQLGNDFDVVKSNNPYSDGFLAERREHGTDVFSLDFIKDKQDSVDWQKEVVKSVVRNFFGAIIDKKLIVEVEEYNKARVIIDHESIESNLDLFNPDDFSSSKDYLADGYIVESVQCYLNGQMFESSSDETKSLGRCFIRIIQDDSHSRHFTFMRGPRMLIKSERIRNGDLGFSGVFVCDSLEGNKILRRLEDSHHKNWKFESSADKNVKKEITSFIKRVVEEVAKFDNPDEFSISGTSLLAFGGNSNEGSSGEPGTEEHIEESAVVIPKNVVTTRIKSSDFSGEIKINKDGKTKAIKPKKPKYQKPKKGGAPSEKSKKNREYKVDDFKALIFKNDEIECEYHLFIFSEKNSNIRTISFDMVGGEDGMRDISFIESITDSEGNQLNRDTRPGFSINTFENFDLAEGENKFTVKLKFNKKVQILIS